MGGGKEGGGGVVLEVVTDVKCNSTFSHFPIFPFLHTSNLDIESDTSVNLITKEKVLFTT